MISGNNGSRSEATPPPRDTPQPAGSAEPFHLPPPKAGPTDEPNWDSARYQNLTPGPFVPPAKSHDRPNIAWFLLRVTVLAMMLLLIGAIVWFIQGQFEPPQPLNTNQGQLVVVVVVDHLRGDLPERWAKVCDADGFERFRDEGTWCKEVHWPYAVTERESGYASLSTGQPPSRHGIVGRHWWDRERNQLATATQASQMLVPTLGDLLLEQDPQSRVLSIAAHQPAAELLGGRHALAMHLNPKSGHFQLSRGGNAPAWLTEFNSSATCRRWEGKVWTSVQVGFVAEQYAGEDDGPGETPLLGRGGVEFPHAMETGSAYFEKLPATPMSHELIWDLAKSAIVAEQLGQRQSTDLLWLGFSATGPLGEAFGPDSQEMLDAVVRVDRLLANIYEFLRQHVGRYNFTLIVTGSAGLAPLPERMASREPKSQRFQLIQEYDELESALNTAFGRDGQQPWLKRPISQSFPWVEWNWPKLKALPVPPGEVQRFAGNWLKNRGATATVYDQTVLAAPPLPERLPRQAQLSYHPERCGDWLIITMPYNVPGTGTRSGSPHDYDTQIPFYALGPTIPKQNPITRRVDGLAVASLLARVLNLSETRTFVNLPPGL